MNTNSLVTILYCVVLDILGAQLNKLQYLPKKIRDAMCM